MATVDYQYDWFYLYGAVEPLTGDGLFLELPRLTDMGQFATEVEFESDTDHRNSLPRLIRHWHKCNSS